jgi:hypothetical protein
LSGDIWIAARDNATFCPGQFGWCSNRLQGSLKNNLFWREVYKSKTNSCVYLRLDPDGNKTKFDTSLGLASCEEEKLFLCEVKLFWSILFNKTFLQKYQDFEALESSGYYFEECLEIYSLKTGEPFLLND